MLKPVLAFILPGSPTVAERKQLTRWLSVAALIIVLDQISKLWISSHFVYGESMRVTGFFNLVLAHNSGAAFSFLNDAGGWQRWMFSAIAIVAAVCSTAQLKQLYKIAGVPVSGEQINFCNTGHLASIDWFVSSELVGNKKAKLYDGSMVEWTIDKAGPVEQKVKLQ